MIKSFCLDNCQNRRMGSGGRVRGECAHFEKLNGSVANLSEYSRSLHLSSKKKKNSFTPYSAIYGMKNNHLSIQF